jgi:hypothetical protein
MASAKLDGDGAAHVQRHAPLTRGQYIRTLLTVSLGCILEWYGGGRVRLAVCETRAIARRASAGLEVAPRALGVRALGTVPLLSPTLPARSTLKTFRFDFQVYAQLSAVLSKQFFPSRCASGPVCWHMRPRMAPRCSARRLRLTAAPALMNPILAAAEAYTCF